MLKNKLNNFLDEVLNSFNSNRAGASAKKLTAFAFVILTIVLEIEFTTPDTLLLIVGSNIAFISVLFGIGTFEKTKRSPKVEKVEESNG